MLLIGILLGAVITVRAPAAGFIFTVVAYCLAFFLAARKSGAATMPPLHGAFAASIAYLLVLPLILRDPAGRDLRQIALTLALSISIGAMTGWINDQARKSHV